MKHATFFVLPLSLLALAGCRFGVGSQHRVEAPEKYHALYDNRPQTGQISEVGEVDWFSFEPSFNQSQISIEVLGSTLRSDVELLVTMYQDLGNGQLTRLYADHASEGALSAAHLQLNYEIQNDAPVLIAVRDLMDDEASTANYSITVREGLGDQGNDQLSGAEPLVLGETCASGRIDSMGDLDLYRFEVTDPGVYQLLARLNAQSDTSVALKASLYDQQTQLIDSWWQPRDDVYQLLRYLDQGTYYLAWEDFGRDDFDLAAPYQTCVLQVDGVEAMVDDSQATAEASSLQDLPLELNGSIDHQLDQDWFAISLPASVEGEIQLLAIEVGANVGAVDLLFEMMDATGQVIFSHIQRAGSAAYTQQVRAMDGPVYARVSLADGEVLQAGLAYSIELQHQTAIDEAEMGLGNATIELAQALVVNAEQAAVGKISYRGDIDWFMVEVEAVADAYQVLELALSGSAATAVDYKLQVVLDETLRVLRDPLLSDGVLDLRTSLLVPPLTTDDIDANKRYYVKVSDAYAEKSDALAEYELQATLRPLETFDSALLPTAVDATRLLFADEAIEQAATALGDSLLEVQSNGLASKEYWVNTTALDFIDPQTASSMVVRTVEADGSITIDLPWLGGFVDYSGDQDWYALDLKPLGYLTEGEFGPITEYPDGVWHYLIQIDLIAAAGESAEYQWRFYRDQNQNMVLPDRPSADGDGYFAIQGDIDLGDAAVSLSTAGEVDDQGKPAFWVSNDWNETFYLAVSDFEFVRNPVDGSVNPVSDADWSAAESPYFVKVSLRYVPGEARP